jgi:hypothetical protein
MAVYYKYTCCKHIIWFSKEFIMKKRTVFAAIIGLVLVIGFFIGCPAGNEPNDNNTKIPSNDDPNNTTSKLAKIDIANATNLFLAPASNSRSVSRAASDTNKLFKITNEGRIQEVSYIDENGNTMTTIQMPSAVYNATNDYVVIVFGYDEGYLTRKSDGAVFSLKNVGIPRHSSNHFENTAVIQCDKNGNIYFLKENGIGVSGSMLETVIKINVSNPDNLIKMDYLPSNESVEFFDITKEGHIAYTYRNKESISGSRDGTRIKKSNGSLYNIPTGATFWVGLDDKIRYVNNNNIVRVDIDSNFNISESTTPSSFILFDYGSSLLRFSDRILMVRILNGKGIYEIDNPSNTPREITISQIDTIKYVAYSNTYYYLSGNNSSNQPVLLKINPYDDSVISLLAPNQYDIYKMTVDSNDVVSFNALRMSDGKKVIGQVSSPDNVILLDEEMNSEMIVLERIK